MLKKASFIGKDIRNADWKPALLNDICRPVMPLPGFNCDEFSVIIGQNVTANTLILVNLKTEFRMVLVRIKQREYTNGNEMINHLMVSYELKDYSEPAQTGVRVQDLKSITIYFRYQNLQSQLKLDQDFIEFLCHSRSLVPRTMHDVKRLLQTNDELIKANATKDEEIRKLRAALEAQKPTKK